MRLTDLKLNPDNPRNIKDEKLEKLAQSIKDFPKMMVKRPIVYDENKIIIGGNMRYRAIKKLGLEEVPDEWTSDASDFTPEERHRFIMQDNAEMGEHDWDMVANQYELEDLDAWGIDVPYADPADDVEEDEAPEVEGGGDVASVLGTVYQLGRHRVMCGSATEIEAVTTLVGDHKADLILTDPPYNMAYTGSATARREAIINDKIDNFGEFVNDFMASMVAVAKTSAPYYVFTSEPEVQTIKSGFVTNGLKPHQTLIWKKHRFGFGGADYQHQYEPFVYGWNSHKERYMVNKRNLSDIWEFDRPTTSELHPTMKPIALLAYALNNSSKTDDIVLDLFLGSGSTLIACEQTDRTCYGMELDPKYVDVIRKRYAKFTNNNELPENWEELTPEIAGE